MTRPGGTWQNWGRSESITPLRVEYPRSVAAVQRAVDAARSVGLPVKAVGAGHSFTAIAGKSRLLLDHFAKASSEAPDEIKEAAEVIHQEVGKAVVAFQFYDRLSQRMEHIGESLEKTGHLISDPAGRYMEREWTKLQDEIKANYTMEAERIMFEHILAGRSIAEALEIYHHHFNKPMDDAFGTDDDIELF